LVQALVGLLTWKLRAIARKWSGMAAGRAEGWISGIPAVDQFRTGPGASFDLRRSNVTCRSSDSAALLEFFLHEKTAGRPSDQKTRAARRGAC
jgi:hypothetical protein